MKTRILMLVGALLARIVNSGASDYVVVPADRANQNGNDQLLIVSRMVFKQAYTAQNFSGPVNITGLAFRLDEGGLGSSIDVVIPRLTLTFSTYSGERSSFLYNTPTANAQTLFDNSVSWHTVDRTDTTPNAFDFSVTLSQPYTYDPANGALIMQFSAPSVSGRGGMDLHGPGNGTLGWYVTETTAAGGFAGILVTKFEVTQVPEPATTALLGLSRMSMAFLGGRRI